MGNSILLIYLYFLICLSFYYMYNMYSLLLLEYNDYKKKTSELLLKLDDRFDIFEKVWVNKDNIIIKTINYKF